MTEILSRFERKFFNDCFYGCCHNLIKINENKKVGYEALKSKLQPT